MSVPNAAGELIINEKHKLLGLDHLRAFAISYVVLFHYQIFGHPAWDSKIGGFGWTGVDLFFVLSGFLIAGQLFNTLAKGKNISMREFFIKRFFRIIPPFLFILTLYALVPYLREREEFAPIWRYLTFTLNFGLDLSKYGTFTHAWSLCVEEQFYLILPLTIWLFSYFKAGKKAIYFIVALFAAGFIVRLLSWNYFIEPAISGGEIGAAWNKYIYYPTYNRLDGLLIGVSIAGLYTFYPAVKNKINKYSNLYMLSGLIILIAAYFVGTPSKSFGNSIFGFPLISIGYGLIVAAVVCPSNLLFNAKSVVTSKLATLSYSIYLSHKLIIHVTQNLLGKAGMDKNGNLMMLCCIITAILGAYMMRYLIEKPALRLRNRVLSKVKRKEATSCVLT